MDIRVLNNVIAVNRAGSLSSASANACLTVQALSSQLRKAEDAFGVKIFHRTNKGVTLTKDGRSLIPYIEGVLSASQELDERAAELRRPKDRSIRIALNRTLSDETNDWIIGRLARTCGDVLFEFSQAESIENLENLRSGNVDAAIIIGDCPTNFSTVRLAGVSVPVVAAHVPSSKAGGARHKVIRPAMACPYFQSFNRYIDFIGKHRHQNSSITSGSEFLTVTLIRELDAIGFVSKDVAARSGLDHIPLFQDNLQVSLAMRQNSLPAEIVKLFGASEKSKGDQIRN